MALPVLKLKHIGDSKEGKSSFIHRIRRDDTVYVGATKNAKRRCGEHYRNGYSGSFRYINVADMGKSETFLLDAHVDTTAPTLRFTTENVLGTSALKGPGYIYVINGKKGLPLKELKKQKEADRVKKEAETLAQLAEAQKKIEEAQEQLAAEKAKNAQHVER